jgi:hypothetical protein
MMKKQKSNFGGESRHLPAKGIIRWVRTMEIIEGQHQIVNMQSARLVMITLKENEELNERQGAYYYI